MVGVASERFRVPRITRTASVNWAGNVARGGGAISGQSGALDGLPYTLATRVGDPEGKTSPEELLAAAVGGCFAMSLAAELTQAESPPEQLDVSAACTVDEVDGQHLVTAVELRVRGTVPGIDAETFERVAREAERGCTMAALVRGSADVTVDATLEGGT
jgi:lipoyl-dependent peroxiredoxin